MELPFLKNKRNMGGGGPALEVTRPSDDGTDISDMIVDEFLQAIEKKDKRLLKEALTALVLKIQDDDKAQDQETP
jgi:hypothetical protein